MQKMQPRNYEITKQISLELILRGLERPPNIFGQASKAPTRTKENETWAIRKQRKRGSSQFSEGFPTYMCWASKILAHTSLFYDDNGTEFPVP